MRLDNKEIQGPLVRLAHKVTPEQQDRQVKLVKLDKQAKLVPLVQRETRENRV